MTQMEKLFRIELDDSGAILSCAEVALGETKLGTKHVRYVHALDAAAACDDAKRWYRLFQERRAESYKAKAAKNHKAGLCVCGRAFAPGKKSCPTCLERKRASSVRHRRGESIREPMTPDQVRENLRLSKDRDRKNRQQRWGNVTAVGHAITLKRLDALGPDAFRADLCDRIRKAGGGAALDEYEQELAKKRDEDFQSALKRCEERYPPEAAE